MIIYFYLDALSVVLECLTVALSIDRDSCVNIAFEFTQSFPLCDFKGDRFLIGTISSFKPVLESLSQNLWACSDIDIAHNNRTFVTVSRLPEKGLYN